jgi:predicted solute-binding protein
VAKRLGIIAQTYAQPLFAGLKENKHFSLDTGLPAQLAIKLREKNLDGAFLSPIDYAKDYAMYRIIPKVAAVSTGESGSALLLFNENIRKIESLAVDPSSASEIVLASLILQEKYDARPKLIPTIADADTALRLSDAYLAVGDTALKYKDRTNKIDLVDEWTDLTGLPFVHGVWVSREDILTGEEMKMIIDSVRLYDQDKNSGSHFQFELTDQISESLTEFFRLAYYHGILQDITDVKFFHLTNE